MDFPLLLLSCSSVSGHAASEVRTSVFGSGDLHCHSSGQPEEQILKDLFVMCFKYHTYLVSLLLQELGNTLYSKYM